MGNEATSPLLKDQAINAYVYETVDTSSDVVTAFERILTTYADPVALVVITLAYENEEKAAFEHTRMTRHSTDHLMQNLRPLVRKTDHAFLLDHRMYFLLLGANEQGGQIVQSRLWEALLWRVHNMTGREVVRPRAMSIGYSAYPGTAASIPDFLEEASNARMRFDLLPEKTTRKTGARQSRHSLLHQRTMRNYPPWHANLAFLTLRSCQTNCRMAYRTSSTLSSPMNCTATPLGASAICLPSRCSTLKIAPPWIACTRKPDCISSLFWRIPMH